MEFNTGRSETEAGFRSSVDVVVSEDQVPSLRIHGKGVIITSPEPSPKRSTFYIPGSADNSQVHSRNPTSETTDEQTDDDDYADDADLDYDKNVVAVFVARFDTHRGNMIEWQYPADFNLEGIEFQAIVSGLHNVAKDTIYFTKPPYFGLSVYENAPTLHPWQERGARMCAVGVVVIPSPDSGRCGQIWRHVDFLKAEVSEQIKAHHPTEGPDYTRLTQYYEKSNYNFEILDFPSGSSSQGRVVKRPARTNRGISISSVHGLSNLTRSRNSHAPFMSNPSNYSRDRGASMSSLARDINASTAPLEMHHPAHGFSEFVRSFGPNIFVLWRASLLKRRVLFCIGQGFEDDTVRKTCEYVYNTCLLATLPRVLSQTFSEKGQEKLSPLFCVGVNDISLVEGVKGGYVACTTDRIYQQKQNLYDILVNLNPLQAGGSTSLTQTTKNLLRIPGHPEFIVSPTETPFSTKHNATDIRRYRILRRILLTYEEAQFRAQSDVQSSHSETHPLLEDNNDDADTLAETTRKMVFGGWFWWYGRDSWGRKHEHPELDVEELFPSTTRRKPRWWRQAMQFSKQRRRDTVFSNGSEGLLGGMEVEEDAGEIRVERTNSGNYKIKLGGHDILSRGIRTEADIIEEPAPLPAADDTPRPTPDILRIDLEVELIRFFHLLSTTLLTTLRSLLLNTIPEEDDGYIFLYPEHMLQLGLDPTADAGFVEELSKLYFGKDVEVVRAKGWCTTCWDSVTDNFDGMLSQMGCCCFEGMGV